MKTRSITGAHDGTLPDDIFDLIGNRQMTDDTNTGNRNTGVAGCSNGWTDDLGPGGKAVMEALRAMSGRIEALEAERDALADFIDSKHSEHGNIWRYWRDMATKAVEKRKTAEAERDALVEKLEQEIAAAEARGHRAGRKHERGLIYDFMAHMDSEGKSYAEQILAAIQEDNTND
jgi:hypothetical protein